MKVTHHQEKVDLLSKMQNRERFKAADATNGEIVRCCVERNNSGNNTVFVFAKGSSRRGYRFSEDVFLREYNILQPRDSEEVKWHRRLKKAVRCLEASGLWPDVKKQFEQLLTVSYDDRKAITKLYWDWFDHKRSHLETDTDGNKERVYNYDPGWENPFVDWAKKYPFMFSKDEQGVFWLDCNYIFEMSDCRLKSMYFGKGPNAKVKEEIRVALENKQAYDSGRYRTNYDVNFTYRPEKQKAWYSEEYKNCGNGHYYIALDANTALFVEND